MRQGEPVVVIGMARRRVDPFGDREIELATTFAALPSLAIENARFDRRTAPADHKPHRAQPSLLEALEQQTAGSEVLEVISGSHGDLQPVFASMLEKAVRICDARFGNIHRWDGAALILLPHIIRRLSLRSTPPLTVSPQSKDSWSHDYDQSVVARVAMRRRNQDTLNFTIRLRWQQSNSRDANSSVCSDTKR
jgi:hypothetical protein